MSDVHHLSNYTRFSEQTLRRPLVGSDRKERPLQEVFTRMSQSYISAGP